MSKEIEVKDSGRSRTLPTRVATKPTRKVQAQPVQEPEAPKGTPVTIFLDDETISRLDKYKGKDATREDTLYGALVSFLADMELASFEG